MSAPDDPRELLKWFAQLADGTITPADHARLEETLVQSAEARRLWFQHADIEIGLADWATVQQQLAEQGPVLERSAENLQPCIHRPTYLATWITAVAVCAATIFAGYLMWPKIRTEAVVRGVAVLSHSADAEWSEPGESLSVGAVLPPGTMHLKKGAVMFDFYSGAQLIVEGPTELKLTSASEVFLLSGKVNAHVPPQARGFTVDSRDFRLVDRGTDFGMVIRDNQAEVHVFKGEVEIEQPRDRQGVRRLQDGQGSQWRESTWTEIPADQTAFLSEQEITAREAAGAQTRLAVWRKSSQAISEDPFAVIHYRLDDEGGTADELLNSVPDSPSTTIGRLVGCEWSVGRWPSKRAVQFRGEGDRIRLRMESSLTEVTLLAWVRVQETPTNLHALLSADEDVTGSLRWELTSAGCLRFAIARDLGRKWADWEAVNSTPFVTPQRLGQWMLLATTFDGATVRHYGNGEPIGSNAAFKPAALLVGTADVGNCKGKNVRNFTGAMDEFAILGRVLSPAEIRQLYENGKP